MSNKFTTEEIALCKKIAEKHRKKIEHGDWYYDTGKQSIELWWTFAQEMLDVDDTTIPLWQISDCLEFLMERTLYLESLGQILAGGNEYICAICKTSKIGVVRGSVRAFEGKTPLEALLKAIIAILEES